MWYITHWFTDFEKSLHPWDKYHMIMVYDALMELVSILYRIFPSIFISDTGQ